MSNKFIVKIQRPISTNNDTLFCLVYNKDRSIEHEADMVPSLRNLFDEHEFKVYHYAHMEGTVLHIDERAEDQPW